MAKTHKILDDKSSKTNKKPLIIKSTNFADWGLKLCEEDAVGYNTNREKGLSRYQELLQDLVDIREDEAEKLLPWNLSDYYLVVAIGVYRIIAVTNCDSYKESLHWMIGTLSAVTGDQVIVRRRPDGDLLEGRFVVDTNQIWFMYLYRCIVEWLVRFGFAERTGLVVEMPLVFDERHPDKYEIIKPLDYELAAEIGLALAMWMHDGRLCGKKLLESTLEAMGYL
jgi:hypothetical protein